MFPASLERRRCSRRGIQESGSVLFHHGFDRSVVTSAGTRNLAGDRVAGAFPNGLLKGAAQEDSH